MFKVNSLYWSDGYKIGHKRMLAPNTNFLYGTLIPRSLRHAPPGVKKILVFSEQLAMQWLHDEFQENFFNLSDQEAMEFGEDMSEYLMLPYDASHFLELKKLGYLPIKVKSLPEGVETNPNVPHMTFINTVKGFAWLTLYLETIISSLTWKGSTSATIALQYRRNVKKWVAKTDPDNMWLVDYLCHDFSARGLDPFTMITSGLGHAASHRGSDTLAVIPAARYFYDEPKYTKNENGEKVRVVPINSVNASEHSVSTTKIFTVGERQMIIDWLKEFPTGILSIVADTFDLWKLLVEYVCDPEVKELIMARDGKLVIRPDSGNPVDIVCGLDYSTDVVEAHKKGILYYNEYQNRYFTTKLEEDEFNPGEYSADKEVEITPEIKGVIKILWDEYGGTVNSQGYKVLDSHIGAIYGDSINLERQVAIYERLEKNKFASTNIVLGIGSYTYQYNTRDTFGFAVKGAWFEAGGTEYNIYKDPATDDGRKKSLKGRVRVDLVDGEYEVTTECTAEQEDGGELQVIYEDGKFPNRTTLTEIRERINKLV